MGVVLLGPSGDNQNWIVGRKANFIQLFTISFREYDNLFNAFFLLSCDKHFLPRCLTIKNVIMASAVT